MNSIDASTDPVADPSSTPAVTESEQLENLCSKIDNFAYDKIATAEVRKLCLAWTRRLRACSETEKPYRLAYASKLLEQIEKNALADPFCKKPRTGHTLKPLRPHTKLRNCSRTATSTERSLSSSSLSTLLSDQHDSESRSSLSETEDEKRLTCFDRQQNQREIVKENLEFRGQVVELKKQLFLLRDENDQVRKMRDDFQTQLSSLQAKIATDYVPLAELKTFKDDCAQKYKTLLKTAHDDYKTELVHQNNVINQLKSDNDKLIRFIDEMAVKNKEQLIQIEQKLIRERLQSESCKIDLKATFEKTLDKELHFFRTKSDKLEQLVGDLEKENRKLNRKLKTYVAAAVNNNDIVVAECGASCRSIVQQQQQQQQQQSNTLSLVGELSKQADLLANLNEKRNADLARLAGQLETRYREIIENQQRKFRTDSERNLERIANLNRELARQQQQQQQQVDAGGDSVPLPDDRTQYSLNF